MAWDEPFSAWGSTPTPPPDPPQRARRSRTGPRVVAAGVALILLAAGGVGAWVFSHRDDPDTAALPAATKTSETSDYLETDGKVIVDFWRLTGAVDGGASPEECTKLAARLARSSTPAVLVSLAQAVPEPATRDAALAHVSSVATYLSACGNGEGVSDAAEDVRYSGTVLGRLFERAGVR